MSANHFGFNPAVMIDPVTMNPIVRGGSITVNPMGMPVPVQQKPWLKLCIRNLHEQMPDELIKKLLSGIGNVKQFKRMQNPRTKVKQNYCIFELDNGEEVVKATKFMKDVKILDRPLQLIISKETESFLKEWMAIQKEEWRKKLIAPGSNEAKEYQSLEKYLERDDKDTQERLSSVIRDVNSEFRKYLQTRQREDERREHPRQKDRDKKKKKAKEDQEKKYSQKLSYWQGRQKDKEKDYRKDLQREKDKERAKRRRLEKESETTAEQESKRIARYLNPDRKKQREKELEQDLQRIQLEWMPPEPQLLGDIIAPQGPAPDEVETDGVQQRQRHVFCIQEQELLAQPNQQIQHLLQLESLKEDKKYEFVPKADSLFTGQVTAVPKARPIQLRLPQVSNTEDNRQHDDNTNHNEQQKRKKEELQKSQFELYKQVPKSKEGLWSYKVDWGALSKSQIMDRKIRPWLFKICTTLLGQAQETFVSIIQKFIINRTPPDDLCKALYNVLDNQTEEFVIKLWKELIFNLMKLEKGVEL